MHVYIYIYIYIYLFFPRQPNCPSASSPRSIDHFCTPSAPTSCDSCCLMPKIWLSSPKMRTLLSMTRTWIAHLWSSCLNCTPRKLETLHVADTMLLSGGLKTWRRYIHHTTAQVSRIPSNDPRLKRMNHSRKAMPKHHTIIP